jgi:hypothetical protein
MQRAAARTERTPAPLAVLRVSQSLHPHGTPRAQAASQTDVATGEPAWGWHEVADADHMCASLLWGPSRHDSPRTVPLVKRRGSAGFARSPLFSPASAHGSADDAPPFDAPPFGLSSSDAPPFDAPAAAALPPFEGLDLRQAGGQAFSKYRPLFSRSRSPSPSSVSGRQHTPLAPPRGGFSCALPPERSAAGRPARKRTRSEASCPPPAPPHAAVATVLACWLCAGLPALPEHQALAAGSECVMIVQTRGTPIDGRCARAITCLLADRCALYSMQRWAQVAVLGMQHTCKRWPSAVSLAPSRFQTQHC